METNNHNQNESTVCFQYCLGEEPYIQYGCIITIDTNEWQPYVQKCLEHYFNKEKLLKENHFMDIELYDKNVIIYPHRISMSGDSFIYGDYNLYIDIPNNYYVFNGSKSFMQ